MIPPPAFSPIPSSVCRPAGSISAFGGETGDGTKGLFLFMSMDPNKNLPTAERQVVG